MPQTSITPTWIQISTALLTPLIALITVSILVFQYRLAKQRWRLDLYDKRYAAYWATIEYLSNVVTEKQLTYAGFKDLRTKFMRKSMDKEFLFGEDVQAFLNLICEESSQLARILDALNDDEKKEQNINLKKESVSRFLKQLEVSKELFRNYLEVERSWLKDQFNKVMMLLKRVDTAV
jgi:hypothetical protein